jgi:hypothetical protein
MLGISRTVKYGAAILAAAVMLVTFALPSYADSGTVRFRITRAGFIIGAGGGTGTLVWPCARGFRFPQKKRPRVLGERRPEAYLPARGKGDSGRQSDA